MSRGYIGCGHLLASGAALFGNKGGIAHFNIDGNAGFTPFGNMTLACGMGAAPAGGVFVVPEGRSGCTCATAIHTSIVLYPRAKARAWGVGAESLHSSPKVTPVSRLAVNLGAPGFREDGRGTLWIPYPGKGGAGLLGKWLPTYRHGADMFYQHRVDRIGITGTDEPWIYASGYRAAKALSFRLIDRGQPAGRYTVTLHFAEPEDVGKGARVFDVSLQGKQVLSGFDIVKEAGGARKALRKEFKRVDVSGDLVITLAPAASSKLKRPVLSGFEAVREK